MWKISAKRRRKPKAAQRRIWQLSRQEFFALCLPAGGITWVLLLESLYVLQPNAKLFLYSCLPEKHKNMISFCLLMLEEAFPFILTAGAANFTLGLQLMFFEKIHPIIQNEILL